MMIVYNSRLNKIGLYMSKWNVVAIRQLTYVYAPGGRKHAIEREDMAPFSQDWEYIGEL